MKDEILEFSKELISIESTDTNKQALQDVVELSKSKVHDFHIFEFERENRPSILVSNSKTPKHDFKIILSGHLDVVEAKAFQYKPEVRDGRLLGRGAYDMKAACAVMALVFRDVADKIDYDLGLQLTTDEEIGGHDGVGYQIENGTKAEFVIAGEPTDFRIKSEAKGIYRIRIRAEGRSAHGAYPWLGDNAIHKMNKFVNLLNEQIPVPASEVWASTANLATISTANHTINKVPDDCEIQLDIRFVPADRDVIIDKIRSILPADFEMEIMENEPPFFTDPNSTFVRGLLASGEGILSQKIDIIRAHGASDLRHFDVVKAGGVEFGPVGGGHHTDEEWVDIDSLVKFYDVLRDFLLNVR